MSAAYTRFSQNYIDGVKRFDFDATIYAAASVKRALIKAQHGKCAFCESKITHISYGDVEHFRPKAGYRQAAEDDLKRPGYYWLAYEWDNLFLSCQLCNQRHKRNLFPLENPADRAESHRGRIGQETPQFIDPSAENPEMFISFRKEIPYAIGDNPKGDTTIKSLGLRRNELNEIRWDRYEMLRYIYTLANLDPPIPESAEARNYLARAQEDSAEFASMARAAVAAAFSVA